MEFHEPVGSRGSVSLAHLERVVLRGRAQLSTSVLGAIADAGAGVLVLSGRHNRCLATCVGRPHNDVLRRLGQFDAYRNTEARVAWSRMLVAAKAHAQCRLLKKALASRPDKRRQLTRTITKLEAQHTRLIGEERRIGLSSLLGVEGAMAAIYFEGFSALFPASLEFHNRNRRLA